MRTGIFGRLAAALIAACVLLTSLAGVALAEGSLPLAARLVDSERFERYAAYALDQTTGEYAVRANESETALRALSKSAGAYAKGTLWFYLELRGNVRTGLVDPTLVVYLIGGAKLNCDTLSFTVDGTRYDCAVTSEAVRLGSTRAERMEIGLNVDGLALVRAISKADAVMLRAQGDGYLDATYTRGGGKNDRERFECSSLDQLSAMLGELDEIGAYALYDQNEAVRKAQGKPETELRAASLTDNCGLTLDKDFALLSRGDRGEDVKAYQELLKQRGFLFGKATNVFGDDARAATKVAQRYYGLPETGSADAALVNCLRSGEAVLVPAKADLPAPVAADGATNAEPGAVYAAGGALELSLSRCWFARAALSSAPGGALSERTSANADNVLFIADGHVRNVAAEETGLYACASAKLVYGGKYEYACELLCESDAGARFDDTLLPLGGSRFVVISEVPSSLATAGGAWALVITVGDAALTYTLE